MLGWGSLQTKGDLLVPCCSCMLIFQIPGMIPTFTVWLFYNRFDVREDEWPHEGKTTNHLTGFFIRVFSYFYLFLFWSWAQGTLMCWSCLLLLSGHCDPGNRAGCCCVYGFMTAASGRWSSCSDSRPFDGSYGKPGRLHHLEVAHFLSRRKVELVPPTPAFISVLGSKAQDTVLTPLNLKF